MPTGQTIVTQALVNLGVYSPGEPIAPSENTNGLNQLNILIDALSGDRDMVYEIGNAAYLLTSNQYVYTIGPSGPSPFNVARPIVVTAANILIAITGGDFMTMPIEPDGMLSAVEWSRIKDKNAIGDVPERLYYDPGTFNTNGNGLLYLNPAPRCTATTKIELWTWTTVTQFATLATNITLPPTYLNMLINGLSVQLIPTYGALLNPATTQLRVLQYQESLRAVRDLNAVVQKTDKDKAEKEAMAQQIMAATAAAQKGGNGA